MGKERVRIVVRGKVQGVFFRVATKDMAERLGLTGWVKNKDDGGVEIVAEGESEDLRELVKWSRRGPADAAVDLVETEWSEDIEEFNQFTVEYH